MKLYPELLKIGPLTITSWGFTLSIALFICTLLALKKAKGVGFDPNTLLDMVVVVVISGLVGARLFYALFYAPTAFSRDPLMLFRVWEGGLVWYGGFLGGLLAFVLFVRAKGLSFLEMADLFSPYVALGYGIVRIGCFLNGCCWGKPAPRGFGVVFHVLDDIPRYPTQLFSSLLGFLLFGFLLYRWEKRSFPGEIFLLYLMLYSLGRIIIEGFRENLIIFGPVTISQAISALIFILALGGYLTLKRKNGGMEN